jgi:hypothetical protein
MTNRKEAENHSDVGVCEAHRGLGHLLVGKLRGFCGGRRYHHAMGNSRPGFSVLGHLTARDQYGHDYWHIPDGFLDPACTNKESLAVQLKSNEIVAALEGASNRLINVEDLPEKDVVVMFKHLERLSSLAGKDQSITNSHSIEEANQRHEKKSAGPDEPEISNERSS